MKKFFALIALLVFAAPVSAQTVAVAKTNAETAEASLVTERDTLLSDHDTILLSLVETASQINAAENALTQNADSGHARYNTMSTEVKADLESILDSDDVHDLKYYWPTAFNGDFDSELEYVDEHYYDIAKELQDTGDILYDATETQPQAWSYYVAAKTFYDRCVTDDAYGKIKDDFLDDFIDDNIAVQWGYPCQADGDFVSDAVNTGTGYFIAFNIEIAIVPTSSECIAVFERNTTNGVEFWLDNSTTLRVRSVLNGAQRSANTITLSTLSDGDVIRVVMYRSGTNQSKCTAVKIGDTAPTAVTVTDMLDSQSYSFRSTGDLAGNSPSLVRIHNVEIDNSQTLTAGEASTKVEEALIKETALSRMAGACDAFYNGTGSYSSTYPRFAPY